jgi:glycosyltransferase involved in cell wall biosynthesis
LSADVYPNKAWNSGLVPITVVMISLNEGHNLKSVCENLSGWAKDVILVDSYSEDDTVSVALSYGVKVVQRKFRGFGDQWNFAINELPIETSWVMKLDPDERLTEELKLNIEKEISKSKFDAFYIKRRLWFMARALPIHQEIIRIWKNGTCKFTDVSVNERPIINGKVGFIVGDLEHYDSPSLAHWLEKQNRYTSLEAIIAYENKPLADKEVLFGTSLQRHMWLKRNFYKFPFRYFFLFVYHFFYQKSYQSGMSGYIWSKLRVDVIRYIEYKHIEIKITGGVPKIQRYGLGTPDKRVKNYN